MSNPLVEFFPFFSTLLRTSEQMLLFVSNDCEILYASPSVARRLNVENQELNGQQLFDVLRLEDADVDSVLKMRSWQGRAILGGKCLDVSLSRTAPVGGKPPGILVELQSVTQIDSATHQNTELESLGILSCSVAHDLNNILAGILGHVSFLRLSLPMSGSDQESLQTIEQGTRKAAQLTKQVLEFARGQQIQPSGVHLGGVVEDVVKLIKTSVPAGVTLETTGLDKRMYVLGDEGKLNQLILNLAVNARDAVGARGNIKIEVAARKYTDVSACAELGIDVGDYVVLSVRDTGPGIDEAIQAKIFEPFFTTKEGKGTGLGLATVQAIVGAHRGLLVVDSAPGQGTCFEIALPQTKALVAEQPQNIPEVTPKHGSERILIVDDEDAVRMIMEKSLEHLGYEVVAATNGEQALNEFSKGEFKLVILDMIMPGMAGDEVYAALRKIKPDVAVMIASGYASDGRIRSMLADGARGYIQKPFSVEELAQEVRNCLDVAGQNSLSSEAA